MDDRELDMLVAEKVMGWVWINGHDGELYSLLGPREYLETWKARFPECSFGDPAAPPCGRWFGGGVSEQAKFTTDIGCAWEVVEKMRLMTPQRLVSIRDWEPVWHVNVLTMSQEPKFSESEDANVCRAICLAALRAVGVDV